MGHHKVVILVINHKIVLIRILIMDQIKVIITNQIKIKEIKVIKEEQILKAINHHKILFVEIIAQLIFLQFGQQIINFQLDLKYSLYYKIILM
jgi:hypothetical protein